MTFPNRFFDKDKSQLKKLKAESLIAHILKAPKDKQKDYIALMQAEFKSLKTKINTLEARLNQIRQPYWPQNKIIKSLISSVFGMTLRYSYDWFIGSENEVFGTVAKGTSYFMIGIASLYACNFLESNSAEQEMSYEVSQLTNELVMYQRVLISLGVELQSSSKPLLLRNG